jgi:superfamily I DNA and/or RNA helicase
MEIRNASLRQKHWGGGDGRVKQRLSSLMRKGLGRGNDVEQVLVTSYSNVAVNNILAGLLKAGVKAVRIGHSSGLTAHTLTTEAERLPIWGEVIELREKGEHQEADRLQRTAQDRVMDEADVICATCVAAGADMLAKRNFTHVLVDEATQATEAATLVPVMASACKVE